MYWVNQWILQYGSSVGLMLRTLGWQEEDMLWAFYLNDLKKAHINLSGNPDEFIFYIMNKERGDYSTQIGYAGLQGPPPED